MHAPNFVIYKDKYNKVIPLEVNVDSKKYGVYIVYGKNDVKVKGANQIWYQIDQFKIKTIPQQQIDLKNAVLAIFQK